jgi:hypothetical protein
MSTFKVLSGSKNSLLNELNIRKSGGSGSRKRSTDDYQSIQIKYALAKVLGHEEGFRKGMVNFVYRFSPRIILKK